MSELLRALHAEGRALPKPAVPDPPPGLSRVSVDVWPQLAADVAAVGGGADVDYRLLSLTLQAEDRLAAVKATLDREGLIVNGSQEQPRPHPLLAVEAGLRREVADGYLRLRLGPGDRRFGIRVNAAGRLELDDDD